jgi:hypothetical protein
MCRQYERFENTKWSLVMLEMERKEKGLDDVRKIAAQHPLMMPLLFRALRCRSIAK